MGRAMESIITQQQTLIGSLQSRSDRGSILESRSFQKLAKFSGGRDGWADWAPVLLSFITTVSPQLKNAMEAALAVNDAWNIRLEDEAMRVESRQLHYMLTQLLSGTPLDIALNVGEGEGLEAWRRMNLEYDPRASTRTAGGIMEILKHPFTAESASFETFEKLCRAHARRTGKQLEEEIKVGVVLSNMMDIDLKNHLVMQSKRLTTFVDVRSEVADIARTRAATGAVPMMVDAIKGKGKGKDGDKSKGKGKDKGKSKSKKGGPSLKKCYYCDQIGHMKGECQVRAHDMAKAQREGRPFVDQAFNKSKGKTGVNAVGDVDAV